MIASLLGLNGSISGKFFVALTPELTTCIPSELSRPMDQCLHRLAAKVSAWSLNCSQRSQGSTCRSQRVFSVGAHEAANVQRLDLPDLKELKQLQQACPGQKQWMKIQLNQTFLDAVEKGWRSKRLKWTASSWEVPNKSLHKSKQNGESRLVKYIYTYICTGWKRMVA